MKEIKIDLIHRTMIETVLEKYQHNTWMKELNYQELENATLIAESLLNNVLFKKDRQNIKARIRSAYNALKPEYPDGAKETVCHIRRGAKYWYLISVERVPVERAGSIRVEIEPKSLEPKMRQIFQYLSKSLKSN